MRFTKMQGCGNDYVYINCFEEKIDNPSELAIKISNRHYGVGSDGLILIEPSDKADAFMHMFNSDGSESEMCGNGIRCVAKYIYDHGIIQKSRKKAFVDTPVGIKEIELEIENDRVKSVTVNMGQAKLTSEIPEKIKIDKFELNFIGIDIGNPHAVYFLEDNEILGKLYKIDLEKLGPEFENHKRFPERVNSEFIEIISRNEINFRVWERGSGETLACGTGASASVFAGVISGKLDGDKKILVHLSGGDLEIKIEPGNLCLMSGAAVEVFNGEIK